MVHLSNFEGICLDRVGNEIGDVFGAKIIVRVSTVLRLLFLSCCFAIYATTYLTFVFGRIHIGVPVVK